jgi:hypothetical protein
VANPDPSHAHHLAVLAEPLDGPDNTTCGAVQLVIHNIIKGVMPRHTLSHVRHYLAHQCTKSKEMSVRSNCQRLVFINTQETPWIPPFGFDQAFDGNTRKEIMLFATLPEWQREMDQMGFDPNHYDSLGLLLFMENIETTEPPIPVTSRWHDLLGRLHAIAQEHPTTNP